MNSLASPAWSLFRALRYVLRMALHWTWRTKKFVTALGQALHAAAGVHRLVLRPRPDMDAEALERFAAETRRAVGA